MPRLKHCLVAALVLTSCMPLRVLAYGVDFEGPDEAVELLEKYLDLYRWRSRDIEADELRALVERTPADAEALLNTAGYFTPKIAATLSGEAGAERVRVTVDSGPLAMVREVALQLEGQINEDPAYRERVEAYLQRDPALARGLPFSQSGWSAYKRRALNALQFRRYAGARITHSEARVVPGEAAVDLSLTLDSGPYYRYGEIMIEGLLRYPERIVRDQIHLDSGSEFHRRDLQELQSDLQEMPQFATVIVEPVLKAEPPYHAPVKVTLQEAPMQKFTAGFGYNTNTGFRTELTHRYNNVADRGWVLDSKIRWEQLEQELGASLTFPRERSGYDHRVYMNVENSKVSGLDSSTYKAGVARSIKGDKIDRTITLEYLTERREVVDGEVERPQTLSLSYQWIRRELDSLRNPRDGSVLQLEAGGGIKQVLSDTNFLRLYGRSTYYWPMAQKDVLITRIELGNTLTHDPNAVPTDFLFRAGGSNSVRGYDFESLGIQTGDGVQPARALATATLEYQHAIFKDWRAAAFVDYGDAADRWQDFEGKAGVGVGARWVSPVGVLGADVAYGIDEQQWRVYFALGVAF
ncbi:MAG TPA: BamA/TamA family outer membrane protein [Chitinolyticbacter sp.]|nr:BamA/TamA family outer membrane protein [Chitinolyticbacter sp.]